MRITSEWCQEWCRGCHGSGVVGTAGRYRIFCEQCDGTGTVFTERCCLES